MNCLTLIRKHNCGFSLVEMAVVLVILGFVISALLLPLQGQREIGFRTQTENQLELARKALIGFAQANGRLPCPATNLSNGVEDVVNPLVGGTCSVAVGLLPSATLGIKPTDTSGFAIDGWNNRVGYAVTQARNDGAADNTFTTSGAMNNIGVSSLMTPVVYPSLRVCASATGITLTRCSGGTESNYLTNNAVAVIFSTGSTGSDGPNGADEAANLDGDSVFVSHTPTPDFDHIVTWISPYVLYNAMITAGQLR